MKEELWKWIETEDMADCLRSGRMRTENPSGWIIRTVIFFSGKPIIDQIFIEDKNANNSNNPNV